MAVSTNEKYSKLRQRGQAGVTWPTIGILWPFNISWTVEARNIIFGTDTDGREFYQKEYKIMARWITWGHWPTFRILLPVNISGTVEVKNVKFGTESDFSDSWKNAKLGQKGNFGTTQYLRNVEDRSFKFGTDTEGRSVNTNE